MPHSDGSKTMQVLVYIKTEIESGHGFPTYTAIDHHMHWSCGAKDAIDRSVRRGDLKVASRRPWRSGYSYTYALADKRAAA